MMKKPKKSKQAGTFTLSSGKDVYGELTLAGQSTSLSLPFVGQSTSLYCQDKPYFDIHDIPGPCMKGILHDMTKVTLIQCITRSGSGFPSRGEQRYNFASIFPHYVVHGEHHIDPAKKEITAVHFVVDDATTLFYDFDAFGRLRDARPFIEQIAHANGLDREITTGPDPQILYFTGKREIFAADTALGRVSASHNPSGSFGGPDGVELKNTIFVTITFREAVTFNDTIDGTCTLLRYLEMLIGRPQNLLELNINVESDDEYPASLQVYWSMPPERGPSDEGRRPHPAEVLLDAVRQPAVFSRVLGSWLDRQQDWHDARLRFSESFAKQRYYSIDRLIGSANMFDILPNPAIQPAVQLSQELKRAKKDCHTIFKKLPQSLERNSVLNALGRVGKSVVKHKIRYRSQLLIDSVGELFPDLFTVTDEAVNCRNHYVHGSDPSFDYRGNFEAVVFFTDTLEFVFAASDLIEAGWDANAWSEVSTSGSHPFIHYRVNYAKNLQKLKGLIAQRADA